MVLTKRSLDYLRKHDYVCSKLSDAQAEELLAMFGQEPYPQPPHAWDEEAIWHMIRKMTQL